MAIATPCVLIYRCWLGLISGAVLVFLPGWSEISTVLRELESRPGIRDTALVLPLHGNLHGSSQVSPARKPRPCTKHHWNPPHALAEALRACCSARYSPVRGGESARSSSQRTSQRPLSPSTM